MAETPLGGLLRERVAREGPLSFRDVMQAALYDPQFGYYTNLRGFGADGDFITSPERHPAFGWLLGRQALDLWEALERPRPFKILELGAGSGALAESLMQFLREHVPSTRYTLDELSPSLRSVQQARLRGPEFCWEGVEDAAHLIVANEVADALPVHRAVVRGGRLRELLVGLDERGHLTWVEEPEASVASGGGKIGAYFQQLNYEPPEGQVVDVCLELPDWVKGLARRLEQRGLALVIDYAASPPRDTLLTYYRHTLGSDPLVRLGQQDISAHVDMRTLVRVALAEKLQAGAVAQRGLLFNLGFAEVQRWLTGPTDRQALAQLVDPNEAGGQITAVLLLRGLAGYRPAGAVGRDWPEPTQVPSLPPDRNESDFLSQWHEAFSTSYEER